MDLIQRTEGTASVGYAILVAVIGAAGLVGMSSLGDGMGNAVAGHANGEGTVPLQGRPRDATAGTAPERGLSLASPLSAQAGVGEAIAKFAKYSDVPLTAKPFEKGIPTEAFELVARAAESGSKVELVDFYTAAGAPDSTSAQLAFDLIRDILDSPIDGDTVTADRLLRAAQSESPGSEAAYTSLQRAVRGERFSTPLGGTDLGGIGARLEAAARIFSVGIDAAQRDEFFGKFLRAGSAGPVGVGERLVKARKYEEVPLKAAPFGSSRYGDVVGMVSALREGIADEAFFDNFAAPSVASLQLLRDMAKDLLDVDPSGGNSQGLQLLLYASNGELQNTIDTIGLAQSGSYGIPLPRAFVQRVELIARIFGDGIRTPGRDSTFGAYLRTEGVAEQLAAQQAAAATAAAAAEPLPVRPSASTGDAMMDYFGGIERPRSDWAARRSIGAGPDNVGYKRLFPGESLVYVEEFLDSPVMQLLTDEDRAAVLFAVLKRDDAFLDSVRSPQTPTTAPTNVFTAEEMADFRKQAKSLARRFVEPDTTPLRPLEDAEAREIIRLIAQGESDDVARRLRESGSASVIAPYIEEFGSFPLPPFKPTFAARDISRITEDLLRSVVTGARDTLDTFKGYARAATTEPVRSIDQLFAELDSLLERFEAGRPDNGGKFGGVPEALEGTSSAIDDDLGVTGKN